MSFNHLIAGTDYIRFFSFFLVARCISDFKHGENQSAGFENS